jgi:molybdopterin-synthase adenylyltransferase
MPFSENELQRYQRQLIVEPWDQQKLKNARVLIVGLGGLGSVSVTYLAAAGVGYLRICDYDTVELSNLNRQILYNTDDIGKSKVTLAEQRLSALNPDIKIEPRSQRLVDNNVLGLVAGCDLIIDGLDNQSDRFILNKISYKLKIPFIFGAINGWEGQVGVFNPPQTPCLACLFPSNKTGPKPVPVFGALPGVIGAIQATMAIRYLINRELVQLGKLLIYNAELMTFEMVSFEKNPRCIVCGSS